jgi:Na+/proline symporter
MYAVYTMKAIMDVHDGYEWILILIITACVLLYSLLGGLYSVMSVDIFQIVFAAVTAVSVPVTREQR